MTNYFLYRAIIDVVLLCEKGAIRIDFPKRVLLEILSSSGFSSRHYNRRKDFFFFLSAALTVLLVVLVLLDDLFTVLSDRSPADGVVLAGRHPSFSASVDLSSCVGSEGLGRP